LPTEIIPSQILLEFVDGKILSAIPPVYTDRIIPSVYTGGITDGKILSVNSDRIEDGISSVGNFYRRKVSVGNSIGVIRFSSSVNWIKSLVKLKIIKSLMIN
jgi:hypothetical protein